MRVTEIFLSIQGESKTVGLPTTFIRLTGCPLRCQYCDTSYAFSGGQQMTRQEIIDKVQSNYAQHVCVTGGEPLAQPECIDLLRELCDLGYKVSLETSGALDVSTVDPRVMKVVDLKTPGSKELSKNLYTNIDHITQHDQIKFVVCDREDFDWSEQIVREYNLTDKCEVLFSPSHNQVSNSDLVQWVLDAKLPVRFQLQAHKYIWGDEPGR